MHAFILAGGFATRLWPLTEDRAKPLLPLAGKPILTHLLEALPADMPVTVSTNAAFMKGFEAWRKSTGRPDIAVCIEQTTRDDHKLGALGATAQWIGRERIAEDVLLLTGDNYCGFSFADFLDSATPGTPHIAAHDIGDREKAKAFGTVIVGSDGRTVQGFEEKPDEPKTTLVSTGCSILPAAHLPVVTEFAARRPDNVGGIFEEFLRRDIPVTCFTFREPWFDIGSFEAYLEATRALVGERTMTAPSARMHASDCAGSVVIGERSHIDASTLRDCVVFDDCRIEDCVLEDCIVDDGCELRGIDLRGKMLRKGTRLTR